MGWKVDMKNWKEGKENEKTGVRKTWTWVVVFQDGLLMDISGLKIWSLQMYPIWQGS